jgi:hypothetical protein
MFDREPTDPTYDDNSQTGTQLPAVVQQEPQGACSDDTPSYVRVRPDPSFVTQLIATAAQMPQTRLLRRASPADAHTSYRSVANQNSRQPSTAGGTSRVA